MRLLRVLKSVTHGSVSISLLCSCLSAEAGVCVGAGWMEDDDAAAADDDDAASNAADEEDAKGELASRSRRGDGARMTSSAELRRSRIDCSSSFRDDGRRSSAGCRGKPKV